MKIGMMLGFEDSIKTITNIARAAEGAGINALYTVDAGRSATITAAAVINATSRAQVGTYIVNASALEHTSRLRQKLTTLIYFPRP